MVENSPSRSEDEAALFENVPLLLVAFSAESDVRAF